MNDATCKVQNPILMSVMFLIQTYMPKETGVTTLHHGHLHNPVHDNCGCECACDESSGGGYGCGSDCYMCD